VVPTWSSRDGERIRDNNNSSSIMFQKQLGTTTGRTIASTFKTMVEATTSGLFQASTQDGGRCSELKVNSLSTRKERLLLSKEELMMKTETSSWSKRMVKFTKDGR